MITHPSDDLAARGTIAFCRRLNEAKDRTVKPGTRQLFFRMREAAGSPGDIRATDRALFKFESVEIFRADGTIERYPAG